LCYTPYDVVNPVHSDESSTRDNPRNSAPSGGAVGKQQRAFLDELYEVQRALNEKHAPPKEGIQERDKLQSKLDGFYVVHSASPTEVVTIVDVKGDRYVVNM
jgi:hypothetical protein